MDDSRRTVLAFALAVERGFLGVEQAVNALTTLKPLGNSTMRGGALPLPELFGSAWETLVKPDQDALAREMALLEMDPTRAEEVVLKSAIPENVRRAWWGDTSMGRPADWQVNPNFEIGEEMPAMDVPEPDRERSPSIPKLTPEERYVSQREVARGGMGRILLVKDATLGRNVALKEMLSGGGGTEDVERFLREARITGQLEHPNIVPVHELGQRADGSIYYTMKMVRGETMAKRLADVMNDGKTSDGEKLQKRLKLLDAFVDVCQALAYAHARGVVNRDLKPANVMLGDFGETVVLDWGLARVRGHEDRARKDVEKATMILGGSMGRIGLTATGSSVQLTMDGAIMGTPAYMSPEQARGDIDDVDERSDVYSLGAILYEIVTGVPPFTGTSAMEVVRKVASIDPPSASALEKQAPRELETLCTKAMAKDKRGRLPSAKLLAEEVLAFRDGRALKTVTYTGLQQASRWVKKHKGLSAGGFAAAVALLAGTVVSAIYAKRASDRWHDAQLAEQRATVEADKARIRAAEAEAAARQAEGSRLAAKSRVQLEKNPGQSLLLAVRGADLAPGAETNSALYAALLRLNERRRLIGTEGYVRCATFSPDGTRVATGGDDMAVRLWDVATGTEVKRLDGHFDKVWTVDFSPDGARLLTTSEDKSARIWSVADGRQVGLIKGFGALPKARWAAGGSLVVTWGKNAAPRVHSSDGTLVATLGDRPADVADVALSPDGAFAATGTISGPVEVRKVSDAKVLLTLPHPGSSWAVRWTPDSREIVTVCQDGHVRTWSADAGAPRLDVVVPKGGIWGDMQISPDGARVAVHTDDWMMSIVRLSDGVIEGTVQVGNILRPRTFSPDWKRVLAYDETLLRAFDIATGKEAASYRGHHYSVSWAEYSRDGRFVVSGSQDMTAAIWNAEPGAEIPLLRKPAGAGAFQDFDPQRRLALYRSGPDAQVVDLLSGETVRTSPAGEGVAHFKFLDDARILAWKETASPWVRVLGPGKESIELKVADGPIVEIAHNGPFVVARFKGFPDGVFRVWDARSGKVLGDVPIERDLHRIHVSPDGSMVASSNRDQGTATLYDTANGKVLRRFGGHSGFVWDAWFLGDGKRLLTSAVDTRINVWDLQDGALLATARWPRVEPVRTFPSPDGRLAWAFATGEARLFDLSTGRQLGEIDGTGALECTWKPDGSEAAFFVPGGVRLVTTEPLAAARRALPREFFEFELAELQVGSEAERREWRIEQERKHPLAFQLAGRGNVHLREKRFDAAAKSFREALAVYPRNDDALLGLARACAALSASADGAEKEKLQAEGCAALRLVMELGLSPAELEKPEIGLDGLKSAPGWDEAARARPPF